MDSLSNFFTAEDKDSLFMMIKKILYDVIFLLDLYTN